VHVREHIPARDAMTLHSDSRPCLRSYTSSLLRACLKPSFQRVSPGPWEHMWPRPAEGAPSTHQTPIPGSSPHCWPHACVISRTGPAGTVGSPPPPLTLPRPAPAPGSAVPTIHLAPRSSSKNRRSGTCDGTDGTPAPAPGSCCCCLRCCKRQQAPSRRLVTPLGLRNARGRPT